MCPVVRPGVWASVRGSGCPCVRVRLRACMPACLRARIPACLRASVPACMPACPAMPAQLSPASPNACSSSPIQEHLQAATHGSRRPPMTQVHANQSIGACKYKRLILTNAANILSYVNRTSTGTYNYSAFTPTAKVRSPPAHMHAQKYLHIQRSHCQNRRPTQPHHTHSHIHTHTLSHTHTRTHT